MQDRYCFDRCEVRPAERLLLVEGVPAPVGARALDLLLCLLAHRDRVLTKSELMEQVWPGLVVEENNLSVQVSSLRKLLGSHAITTIPGRGYQFALAVDAQGPPPSSEAPHRQPTIAVLPFHVLSEDPQLEFLADGLVEDVIALLARVPGFRLISRASSFAFRGHHVLLPEVARQLGVRFVVEGSIRAHHGALRVATQLTEAASGHVLWSGRFDRPREHALEVQEDIARGIMSELEPELTRAEIAHIRRQRTESPSVWAHYHQAIGSLALQGWSPQAMDEARSQLQSSVHLDPTFGLGYAHHALLTALSRNIGYLPDSPRLVADALADAQRAIDLDDGSSEVLGYAGCALCDLGQHEQGVSALRRALDIDPSNAQAHVALGASLVLTGQLDAGIHQMRLGMEISPKDRRLGFWGWALGTFLFRADRQSEALREAQASCRRDPRFHLARVLEAALLERQGRFTEAAASLATARQLCPSLTLQTIAWTHGRRIGERLGPLWQTNPL